MHYDMYICVAYGAGFILLFSPFVRVCLEVRRLRKKYPRIGEE